MLVVGVGNRYRGDDAAGLAVADGLHSRGVRVLAVEGDLSVLLDEWEGEPEVVVVDAARSGAAPGTVQRFDAAAGPLPSGFARGSTHLLGVSEAIELARALGSLPHKLIVYAIEGAAFEAGEGLSPAVAAAVGRVVEEVLAQDSSGGEHGRADLG